MPRRQPEPAKAPIKRRYSTHYFTLPNDREADVVSHGAASTEQGAIRAAIVRVFMGQYRKAVIYDRVTGVALYNIRPGAGGLQVRYGSGIDYRQWDIDSERRRRLWLAEQAHASAALPDLRPGLKLVNGKGGTR